MQIATIIVAAALGMISAAGEARTEPCRTDLPESNVSLGEFKSWERRFLPGQRQVVPATGARYVRVLFRQRDESDATWTLRIRDGDGRPLQSIRSLTVGTEPFWTRRLYAKAVEVVVESDAAIAPVESLFFQMVAENPLPFYSTKSSAPDWSDVYNNDNTDNGTVEEFWKHDAEAVGLFLTAAGNNLDGVKAWTCSGILVADSPNILFLTNDHCGGQSEPRWTHSICKQNGIVDFSWDGDAVSRQHQCLEVVKRSQTLDLALLRLAPAASDDALPIPSKLATDLAAGEALTIIHHPASETKKISRGCSALVSDPSGTLNEVNDFAYDCDTEAGSSGAPVLNTAGELVGLHHTGHEKTVTGQCDGLNKAVRINLIREFLGE